MRSNLTTGMEKRPPSSMLRLADRVWILGFWFCFCFCAPLLPVTAATTSTATTTKLGGVEAEAEVQLPQLQLQPQLREPVSELKAQSESVWNDNDNDKNDNDPEASPLPMLRRRLLEDGEAEADADADADKAGSSSDGNQEPLRILYTVTTLAEYDVGTRATTKGFDRLKKLLVPVVQQGVRSMTAKGYHVDVCIVSHYEMTRKSMVEELLQSVAPSTGVTFWDSAAPLSYDPMKRDDPKAKLWRNTLALARQHRFVVKDRLFDYDLFLNFEDDMVLSGDMVEHYLDTTRKLYRLRETAPETVDDDQLGRFHGQLTKDQLMRTYPGLMRVEVLLDPENYGTQDELDPVPVAAGAEEIDPSSCCHLEDLAVSPTRPKSPTSDQLFLWETNIVALGVRHMGNDLGFMAMLRGPRARNGEGHLVLADYWSGTPGYFKNRERGPKTRPAPGSFNYINNEGGWMGTRQQIWEWHTEVCLGGFLPPFDSPHYNYDGLDPRNVEFWSGGLNLFTARHACNMQRVISLDPAGFSKQLIYHSANNKQRHLKGNKSSFVKINDLYGQLLTVATDAEEQMRKERKDK